MRADALRNRNRIEAAAVTLIAAYGAEISMQAIAYEAGVAVGTLYCHYPTKADLVEAVIESSVERMALLAEPAAGLVADGAEPTEVLVGLLRAIAAAAAQSRALRAAARSLGLPSGQTLDEITPAPGSPLGRVFAAFESILEACRESGSVRADATRRDLSVLLHGVCELNLDKASRNRYIVLAGLAPACLQRPQATGLADARLTATR